jgi:uncharacterized protein (TIGR00661 family)
VNPLTVSGKRIFFAVLNWGLGHAARSSSLIIQLKEKNEIVLASDGEAANWLSQEFKQLPLVNLPELHMRYSIKKGALWGIAKSFPHFIQSIRKDHRFAKKWIEKQNFDLIISDNRYGVYHPSIPSVLITHQLRLHHTLGKWLDLPFRNLIQIFDEVWIPDYSSRKYSGILSEPRKKLVIPIQFLGPVSRFKPFENKPVKYQYLVLVSGPEPHKTAINNKLFHIFIGRNVKVAMVGNPPYPQFNSTNIHWISNPATHVLQRLIEQSDSVITRSGYSSIMDFERWERKVMVVPTPGQPEQVYLARRIKSKKPFVSFPNEEELYEYLRGS